MKLFLREPLDPKPGNDGLRDWPVGWFVIPWDMGILPKFLIIAIVSFLVILLLYELFVRRFNPMRFLFGMRLRKRLPAVSNTPVS